MRYDTSSVTRLRLVPPSPAGEGLNLICEKNGSTKALPYGQKFIVCAYVGYFVRTKIRVGATTPRKEHETFWYEYVRTNKTKAFSCGRRGTTKWWMRSCKTHETFWCRYVYTNNIKGGRGRRPRRPEKALPFSFWYKIWYKIPCVRE